MSTRISAWIVFFVLGSALISSCSKDDPEPVTGKLSGKVTDYETGAALGEVKVVIFHADDNAPTGTTLTTDADGNFSVNLSPGNYFLKYYTQGYYALPAPGMEAVPFTVVANAETRQSAEMLASNLGNAGSLSGKITGLPPGKAVLVVATDVAGTHAYSSVSEPDGNYVIYNVPAGTYSVRAYLMGYNSSEAGAEVTALAETSNVMVALSGGASGKLAGSVRNISAANKDVDVSLIHPLTRETIPGLVTSTLNSTYSINDIPNGTYIARATFANDDRVMDPDRIAKFGEPVVAFDAGDVHELTFDVTGSVKVQLPSNDPATSKPVDISSVKPTFSWAQYSSTSDYVIEVTDASTGVVVWGGFDRSGDLPVKKITIPAANSTIAYNADGMASVPELVPGRVYRWRVFASKNDQNSPTGWTLISASEDQMGIIRVVE